MKAVQAFLFRSEGPYSERDNTVCKIHSRATEFTGDLLGEGPAFWVEFGDDPDNLYLAHGYELSPWFPLD